MLDNQIDIALQTLSHHGRSTFHNSEVLSEKRVIVKTIYLAGFVNPYDERHGQVVRHNSDVGCRIGNVGNRYCERGV